MCVKLGLHVRSFFIRDKSIFKRKGSKTRCHNWSAGSYHTSFSSYKWNNMLTKWQRDKSLLQTQRQPTSLFTVHSILSNEHQKISDLQSISIRHEDPGVSIISKNRVFFINSIFGILFFLWEGEMIFIFFIFKTKALSFFGIITNVITI